MRGRDVEEDELVGAELGVTRRELNRVADVAQLLEANALDDTAGRNVEARDQAREGDRASSSTPARYAAPSAVVSATTGRITGTFRMSA